MKYINEKPWALKAGNAKNMADRAEPACSSLYEAAKHQLLPAGLELAPLAVAHQIAWPEPQRLAERSRKGSRIGISRLQGRLQNGQLTVADAGCCQSQPVAAHIADRSRSENGKEVTLQLPRRRIKRACRRNDTYLVYRRAKQIVASTIGSADRRRIGNRWLVRSESLKRLPEQLKHDPFKKQSAVRRIKLRQIRDGKQFQEP